MYKKTCIYASKPCAEVFLPFLSGSVAGVFAGTTSTMAIIRDKDDFKNWMVGGAVSGSLFGLTSKYEQLFSYYYTVGDWHRSHVTW